MSKESQLPAAEIGKPVTSNTWKGRKGKTRRDKESGAWASRLSNRAARAAENRAGPSPVKGKKR